MSRTEHHTQLPNLLLVGEKISDRAFRLYSVLLYHADEDGICWPSEALLAKEMNKSPRSYETVRQALRELERAGLVSTRWRTLDRNDARIGLLYQLHLYWVPSSQELVNCTEHGCDHEMAQFETVARGPSTKNLVDRPLRTEGTLHQELSEPSTKNLVSRPLRTERQKETQEKETQKKETQQNEIQENDVIVADDDAPAIIDAEIFDDWDDGWDAEFWASTTTTTTTVFVGLRHSRGASWRDLIAEVKEAV